MTSETRLRVRYAETDQMGVVYHSNYFIWFEVGRVEFIRQLGLNYRTMETEHNAFIAVVEATCRYKSPARYDDELIVRTRIGAIRGSVLRLLYTIHRHEPDGGSVLLCEGATTHLVVDSAMKRAPMPPLYAEAFRNAHARTPSQTPLPESV